jgi:hypothetical protein
MPTIFEQPKATYTRETLSTQMLEFHEGSHKVSSRCLKMKNESQTKIDLTMKNTEVNDYAAAYGLFYEDALSELKGTEVWLQPAGAKGMTRRFLHMDQGKSWQADVIDLRKNSRDPTVTAYILVFIARAHDGSSSNKED